MEFCFLGFLEIFGGRWVFGWVPVGWVVGVGESVAVGEGWGTHVFFYFFGLEKIFQKISKKSIFF